MKMVNIFCTKSIFEIIYTPFIEIPLMIYKAVEYVKSQILDSKYNIEASLNFRWQFNALGTQINLTY